MKRLSSIRCHRMPGRFSILYFVTFSSSFSLIYLPNEFYSMVGIILMEIISLSAFCHFSARIVGYRTFAAFNTLPLVLQVEFGKNILTLRLLSEEQTRCVSSFQRSHLFRTSCLLRRATNLLLNFLSVSS